MCLRVQGDSCNPGAVPSRESLDDVAGHLPGSVSLTPVPGSDQVCSELFSPVVPQDVHLLPVPATTSCHPSPFPLEGLIFLPAQLSWVPCPSLSPPERCHPCSRWQSLPASAQRQPSGALLRWLIIARLVCNAAGASPLLLS